MKFRIRSKLAAALAVPLVALVAVTGFQAVEANEESDRIEAEADLSIVALGPGSVTRALQNERNYASLDILGLAGATTLEVASYSEARDASDAAVTELEASLTELAPEVRDAYVPAFESLDDLRETRDAYEDFDGEKGLANQELAQQVFDAYTVMVASFFDATSTLATQVDEAELRNGVEIVDASNRRAEVLAANTRNIVLDLLTGRESDELRSATIAGIERLQALDARILQLSVGPYADVATETFARPATERTLEIFQEYVAGDDVDITELLASVGTDEGVATITDLATTALLGQANALAGDAFDRVRLFTILAAVVIAFAIIVTYIATTSITRPLRALRDEADAMAGRRLPEAVRSILETPLGDDVEIPELPVITVKTRDEVGEVVEALNKVQDRTLALAADQAVLRRNIADSFVNLGRRNQNLLDRQLEFITELEQVETEPDQLESLFRLDHLATRMRRNAESLLVLAGTESPRQWGMPVEMDAVVRAGLGEVEDYRRVTVRNLDAAAVAGGAAAGVSHVIAELVENALQFSPPDEDVEIKGRRSAEGYVVAIADNGIGMPDDDLERANSRLSGEESYTIAPSKYLGHYVAGQLAARLGVSVRLQDNPAGGLIATIVVPPSLLEDLTVDQPEPAPAPAVAVDDVEAEIEDAAIEDAVIEDAAFAGEEAPEEISTSAGSTVDAHADRAHDPAYDGAPMSLSEALGEGRLDDVATVDDLQRVFDGEPAVGSDAATADDAPVSELPALPTRPRPAAPDSGEASTNGLPRRVPGAQRPDASPLTARIRRPEERAETDVPVGADDRPSAHEVATTGLFGFLAEFNDGAARASDATTNDAGADSGAEPVSEEER